MRRPARAAALAFVLAMVPRAARADEGADFARLLLETGRAEVPVPEADAYRFFLRGELQLRYQAERSFPLEATTSAIAAKPGLRENSIGQNQFVHHWLRLTPHLQVRDLLELVVQLDVTGVLFGDKARGTSADATPRDSYDGFSNVQARWIYAEYRLPWGLVRIGQQPNHWGMGILANDGDHPSLFGDYRYGSISDRILFATKPAGRTSDFTLALAGDLVYRDNAADLTRGEHAFQGVLAAFWEKDKDKLGLFSTLRHQDNDHTSGSPASTYTDTIDALAIDLHGKVAGRVPGEDAYFFGEAEAAYVGGSTTLVRTQSQALSAQQSSLRSYGGSAIVGFVNERRGGDGKPYGSVVAQLETGYASGDADPYDDTDKRFVFDPNHRIGLVLFDEVLRWQTARAATAATDPALANVQRPTPGVDRLPTNGGVAGAEYVNPTVLVRPRRWLDLKAGMVLAQSTADVVDPYRAATRGAYLNYRGGDPKKKDLGVELDGGFEARVPLDYAVTLNLGAQAGVLFPGSALEDADGARLATQWVVIGRAGLLF